MPSGGMQRATRVFGVVKGADGARVLRSGRRLWPESSNGKLKKGGARDEFYSFWDSKGSGKQVGRAKNVNLKQEVDKCDTVEDRDLKLSSNKAAAVMDSGKNDEDKMSGILYRRRRGKRKASNKSNLDGKKYGIHFSRRTKRKQVKDTSLEACLSFRGLAVLVKSASCSEDSGLAGFLCSVLRYMTKVSLKMSELSGFLLEDPIHEIYVSRGVHFLWDPPSTSGSGICKFFVCRDDIPMFFVNFSAIPHCFASMHVDILLKHRSMPSAHLNNFTDEKIDSDDEDELLGIKTSCFPSNINQDVKTPVGRSVLHQPHKNFKSDGRSAPSRHGLNSRVIRKMRSSFKCRRARNPFLGSLNENNGALASDLVRSKKNGFPFSSLVSGRKVRRSVRGKPAQDVNYISSSSSAAAAAAAAAATNLVLSQDIESTSCSVNLLTVESGKCFREGGATVLLEPSVSGEWVLVVKRDGLIRHIHKANEAIKSSALNRLAHATVWTGDDGWKLEFLNRGDWLKFKDLYEECLDHNKQVVSPTFTTTAEVKIIPVPGVQAVLDYEDVNLSTFSRPNSYITMRSDEVSRALTKRTATYDMDGEDEEWLRRFNGEQQLSENELREDLKEESFELMIDAFEKAFYYNPRDFSNEKANLDLFVDVGRKEIVEAVYSYWLKKRKHKRSALIRGFQVNQPRKAPLVLNPALRKKRSFKRQASHHGRGKLLGFIQALAAEREAREAHKSLQKLEESEASVSRSLKLAVLKRQRAQFLMGNADLAAYRATMILRIAVAAEVAESPNRVTAHFLN